jgi:O-antigen/teichoic acid export membrane protein
MDDSVTSRNPQLARSGLRRQLTLSGAGGLAIKIANVGLGFLVAVTLARVLGVEGFGTYSYCFALISILAIPAKFGLPNLIVREVAAACTSGDWGRLRGVIRWANMVAAGFCLAMILVAVAVVFLLRDRLTAVQIATFAWGLILVPPLVLGDMRGAALRGLHHVIQGQLPERVLRPAFLVLFCGLLQLLNPGSTLGPADAMRLHAFAAVAAFVIGALLYLRVRPDMVRIARAIYQHRLWIATAMPLAVAGGMQVIIRNADLLVLGLLGSAEDLGVYRAVSQTALLVSIGLTAIDQVVAPQFASLYASDDRRTLQRVATAAARMMLALAVPSGAVMILFGGAVLGLVFGESFSGGHLPLALLAVAQLINAAFGSVSALLNMTGHASRTARGMAITTVLVVFLNFLMIPLFGIAGAAAATSIAIVFWNVLLWLEVRRVLDVDSAAIPGLPSRLRQIWQATRPDV